MGTRRHLWVAFVVGVFAVLAGKALACSYFPPSDQDDRQLLDAPVVFRGRVLTIRSSTSDDVQRQQVTLQLLERFKGALESRVSARKETSNDSCSGVPVPHDFDGMFFAHRDGEGVLHLSGFFRAGTGPEYEPFNRLREERDAADALVRANPGQIEPLLTRARLLRRWRDHEEALIAYRAIADRAPQSIEAFAGIAQVLSAQNKPHEALVVLNEAEARLGPHPDFSAARGVARLVLGERDNLRQLDLRAADLRHIDLSGRDLRGVDFSGALLTAVFFRQSDLRGARFVGTRFDRVLMERANLEGAIFTAPIGFPHVEGANLSRARLGSGLIVRARR